MPTRHLQVIADDLSGAAECAAALAQAARHPTPLLLRGQLPESGNWVFDSDSRAMDAPAAATLVAELERQASAARAPGDLLFKKIDSTLRGNIADELRAILAVGSVQAAVVCPALPTQGRTVIEGVLHVHGQPRVDAAGQPLELTRLLAPVDPGVLLLRPAKTQTSAAVARELVCALERGTRVVAADASDAEDLRRLALAIVLASRSTRLLAVGAAGLAKALATELLQAGAPEHLMLPPTTAHRPIVAVIGSYSPVTTQQVDELAAEAGVHVVRLAAEAWRARDASVIEALLAAEPHAQAGGTVVLAPTGAVPAASTRELVRCIAELAEPLLRRARTLVLTGGDTAHAVLDRLGVARLDVLGELEPGICLSRDDGRFFVTKAGGFGDSHSLVRVLRHLRGTLPAFERKE